jgi:hypothetical protein
LRFFLAALSASVVVVRAIAFVVFLLHRAESAALGSTLYTPWTESWCSCCWAFPCCLPSCLPLARVFCVPPSGIPLFCMLLSSSVCRWVTLQGRPLGILFFSLNTLLQTSEKMCEAGDDDDALHQTRGNLKP